MKHQLTQQQKRFVSEYIKSLDSEMAAKKAGYKNKDLKNFATELLKKEYIIREIKSQINLQINTLSVQRGYVIQKLLQIAEFSLTEEDITDKDGNFTGKRKLRDLYQAFNIKKFFENDTTRTKLATCSHHLDNLDCNRYKCHICRI